MSRYVAFTFGTIDKAAEARRALRNLEDRHELDLYDAVVLAKDAGGRVSRQREPSGVTVIGAMVGSLLGLLLVFLFTPVGILVGGGLGALIATLLFDQRIAQDDIVDAARDLRPGTSALLLLIAGGDVATLGFSLRPFDLRVYQTTLPPQVMATLRRSSRY